MDVFLFIVITLPLLYAGMLLGFYLLQDYLIFRGIKLHVEYQFKFPWDFEERFYVNEKGIRLNAILFKAKNSKGVVFYHHGNSGHLQYWGERAAVFLDLGYDVFMYDYRGYGKSSGTIRREKQLHHDAAFLFNLLKKEYTEDQMVFYGISLGTGIATRLATQFKPRVLILETPYYNFLAVVRFHYPFLPVKLISKYKLKTNYFIKKVTCPVYIIHGTKDETVSFQSSLRLKQKSPTVHFVAIEGGGHNNLPDYKQYHDTLTQALCL